jgi:hypothetical protein
LFIVLSLVALYLFSIGCVVAPLARSRGRLFEQAALALSLGILINYCLMLTQQPIGRVLIAGVVLALLGIVRVCKELNLRGPHNRAREKGLWLSGGAIIYVLAVYYFAIFSEPLDRWDARSIWFFHARMIWAEGALRAQGGWNHPSIVFSHPDYPKLVPAIAAELAYIKGYWNDFLPKGSLFIMLVPLVLWVFGFRRKSASFILLALTFLFGLGVAWFTNGLMDGYLALYCGASLLSFGRYLSAQRDIDLYCGVSALGVAASLKNEGLLFALCVAIVLALTIWARPDFSFRRLPGRLRTNSRLGAIVGLSVAPTVIWTIYKNVWGLENDVAGDPAAAVSRLLARLRDGFSPQYAFDYLFTRASSIWALAALVAIALIIFVSQRRTAPRGAVLAAAAAALYVAGLYGVYLSTPQDLTFHLFTSAGRTMATASWALFISVYFVLAGLEVDA